MQFNRRGCPRYLGGQTSTTEDLLTDRRVQKAATMTITGVTYCTREDVQRSLNLADNPRLNTRVDQSVMAGARSLEGLLHRKFYPLTATRQFDQPDGTNLWLYDSELASAPTSVVSGGKTMTLDTDYFLQPNTGAPYSWLEVSYGGSVFWQSTATPQNAVSVTGDFNYPTTTVAAGQLTSSPASGASTVTISDSSQIGVGNLLLIDLERVIVSDRTISSTTATLTADLASAKSATQVTVSNGSLINPSEMIIIDGERMQVEYVAGNVLTVDRAVNAAALAAHTSGATIYAPRTLTVLRGRLGTTAAAHTSGATINRLDAPSLVRELNLAYAINNQQGAAGAYARSLEADVAIAYRDRGRGISDLENDAYQTYGRISRSRAI